MQVQGHSRKESDDFSKLVFGNDSDSLEASENFLNYDPGSDPSLTFRQPKSRFSSFRGFFGSIFSIPASSCRFRQELRIIMKLYTHPITSVVFLLSVAFPIWLGVYVFFNDYKNSGEYIVIDKSLQSFAIPGHKSAEREDTFLVASKASKEEILFDNRRRKRAAEPPPIMPSTRPAPVYQNFASGTLDLVYLATGDDELNIFTKERIETIHDIEQSLMNQKDFKEYCWKWPDAKLDPVLKCLYDGCTPPISLIDFFYPSMRVFNDGQGREPVDLVKCQFTRMNLTEHGIQSTLKLLLSNPLTYWFVDQSFSDKHQKSKFLRAQVKFGLPLKGHSKKASRKLVQDYIIKYVDALGKMSTDKVQVLYGGSSIYDYEVNKTLWADLKLTIYTIVFIGVFVLVFTRFSIFLMCMGILSILISLCLAYHIFRITLEIKSVGILSGISLFIIIGIGVDDVFVFINTFRQARNAKSLEDRMLHTLCTAGKATFFTSATTAAAFAANCISEMPAIRDFGLFMALIVSFCWLSVVWIIPPALNLWHRYLAKCEAAVSRSLCSLIPCSVGSGNSSIPDNILQFLSGNNSDEVHVSQSSESSITQIELSTRNEPTRSNSDSMLVQLDSSLPNSQTPSPSSSDIDLALFDDPNGTFDAVPLMHRTALPHRPVIVEEHGGEEGCNIGFGLLGFMYRWLGVPMQKYRYAVVVLFCCILVGSFVFDSKIKTSTRPPAFFKKSSNLQQMLDLKYNMSSENLKVSDVKGFFLRSDSSQTNNVNGPTTNSPTKSNGLRTSTSKAPSSGGTRQPPLDQNTSKVHKPSITKKSTTKKSTTAQTVTAPTPTSQKKPSMSGSPLATTKKSTTRHGKENPSSSKPAITSTKTSKTSSQSGDSGNNIDNKTMTPTVLPAEDACSQQGSCKPAKKPIVDSLAVVYVIFGLKGIDRSGVTRESVITDKGDVIPDYKFTELVLNNPHTFIQYACRICKALSTSNKLAVKEKRGDCFPSWFFRMLDAHPGDKWTKECLGIEPSKHATGKSRAKLMRMPSDNRKNLNNTYWMVMAFESGINMGYMSSMKKVAEFDKWDSVLKELLNAEGVPEGMKSGFQTSSQWVMTFMEVIAVNSAIYSIAFSLVLCVAAVAIFTGNFILTIIVMLTILGVLTTVVAIFYLLSWQLGAVEAISLSILVGTSVDYCVHLVEGYIMAGKYLPDLGSAKELRGWRTLAALSHIGTAILSSAVTTIVASIPLCLTTIQLFAKFGQILAINTAVSIFFTLTICMALLCIMGPVRFRSSIKSTLISFLVVTVVSGIIVFILFMVNWKGTTIPGPSGEPIFHKPN